jgi:hypothetical protein
VNNVIHDRITAHAVASHIAALLGSDVVELWPGGYPRGRASPRNEVKQTECEAGGVQ